MRLHLILLFAAVLGGCNMPSPAFRGADATRVTVQGSTFDVRRVGLRAEAIRVNPQYAPRFGPIRYRAAMAMQMVSGCEVLDVSGDQAQAFGRLKCGNKAAPLVLRPRDLDCVPVPGSEIPEIGQVRVELACDPA